jgi:hypothetical protein
LPPVETPALFPNGAERVPQLMLHTGGAAVTAAETSPKGARYPALRDQANGLGPRTRPPLAVSPEGRNSMLGRTRRPA